MPRLSFHRFQGLFGPIPAWMGLVLLLFFSTPARPDVWAYIDETGAAHFAPEPVDARYQLFFRGASPQTGDAAASTARAVAVPTAQPKLVAFFEVAPGFRSVKHLLREASAHHDVDYELLKALIATESGFDAGAVSPKGAIGLMQVMPATAARYGVSADRRASIEQKLADPATNIRAGASYLSYLIRLFPGQLELALAAYNAGEGAVQRAGNRVPNYRETQNYVSTVMQLYNLLKPPVALLPSPRAGARVHMSFPAPTGGALGRGNMIPPSLPAAVAPAAIVPRDSFY
jgi:soluble lytic murein transglycosylase-like protein